MKRSTELTCFILVSLFAFAFGAMCIYYRDNAECENGPFWCAAIGTLACLWSGIAIALHMHELRHTKQSDIDQYWQEQFQYALSHGETNPVYFADDMTLRNYVRNASKATRISIMHANSDLFFDKAIDNYENNYDGKSLHGYID